MENKDKLIEKLEEYVKFLGEELGHYAGYSISHPWMAASQESIDKGAKFREEIKNLKEEEKNSRCYRIGPCLYREIGEGKYEVGLEFLPVKFTRKHKKEIEDFLIDMFGDNCEFKVIEEDTVATKKFIIQKVEENEQ